MSERLLVLLAALAFDRVVGDPDWLWRRLPHPVVLFGAGISFFDRLLNRPSFSPHLLRLFGLASILLLLALSALAGVVLSDILYAAGPIGLVLEAVIAGVFLAQKSLADHVLAVVVGLRTDGLAGGRKAVSMIVGRDPNVLDEAGVCRAAIESLAENFSDGIVAPVFWFAVGGLPGLLAYKMLNTADSMIGHKSEKYLHFGRAAAKLDDAANWIPARFSMILVALGTWIVKGRVDGQRAVSVALRDAGLHRSPNAGWPEAAMAGALDLRLGGPRMYHGESVMEASLNGGGRFGARPFDISDGIRIYLRSLDSLAVAVFAAFAISVFIF